MIGCQLVSGVQGFVTTTVSGSPYELPTRAHEMIGCRLVSGVQGFVTTTVTGSPYELPTRAHEMIGCRLVSFRCSGLCHHNSEW